MCNHACERRLDFVIKRKPAGQFSNWLFDTARAGERLQLFGPLGKATFDPSLSKNILCIAGGSGIAGMMSDNRLPESNMKIARLLLLVSFFPVDIRGAEKVTRAPEFGGSGLAISAPIRRHRLTGKKERDVFSSIALLPHRLPLRQQTAIALLKDSLAICRGDGAQNVQMAVSARVLHFPKHRRMIVPGHASPALLTHTISSCCRERRRYRRFDQVADHHFGKSMRS